MTKSFVELMLSLMLGTLLQIMKCLMFERNLMCTEVCLYTAVCVVFGLLLEYFPVFTR